MLLKRKSKAQSIVEYLLVFGGIVLAVLYGAKKLADSNKAQMELNQKVVNKTANTINTTLGLGTVQ
jgi:uncharacterized protein (UPF0333 family)